MKILVWGVFAFVALLWTGGAALLAQLVDWSAQALATGSATPAGTALATASMPSWLSPWIDAASWTAAQEVFGDTLATFSGWLPAIGEGMAWLVPAVWIAWGLGLLVLFGLTLLATSLLNRFGRGFGPGSQSA